MPKPYWTNRLARHDETDPILRLVRAVHGDEHQELNETYWRWRYLNDTPFRADILMAEHEGLPIGIQPMAIFEWQWGTERFPGTMYTGVLTRPDHRRRGVFRSVIDSSNEHAAQRGSLFCMTMPNDASLPGFLKFGDWVYPASIPLWLKVVDGRNLLRAKLGRGLGWLMGPLLAWPFRRRAGVETGERDSIEAVRHLPDEFDGVFDRFARDCGSLMLRRTAAYWNWRYGAKPDSDYRTFMLRRSGRLVGAVVTSVGRRFGLDIGMILDLVAMEGLSAARALVRAADADFRARGLGLASSQATTPWLERALAEEGYWRPKPSWVPKKFHFVYRPTGLPGMPRLPDKLADWHLMFGDSDNA